MYAYFQIWKKFLPKNRSVLLIHGSVSLPADDEEHRGYNDEVSPSYEFGFFLKVKIVRMAHLTLLFL